MNSFIEAWNAFQLLALAEPDKQTCDVIDLPKWIPPLVTLDWNSPEWGGRFSEVTAGFYPSIRITRDYVDRMTLTFGDTYENFAEFVFANNTSLRFYITGSHSTQLNMYYQFYNYATQTGTQISGTNLTVYYDDVFAEGQPSIYLFPAMFHYFDSEDTSYHWRECWGVLYYATEWNTLKELGLRGDIRNVLPYVMLFSQNNWGDVPSWFWEGNEVEINPEYPEEDDSDEGGFGTYTDVDDEIDFPDAPTISALGSGLVNIYSPDTTSLQNFTRWLWSSAYESNVIKNQASPMENIICFGFVPVSIAKVASTITVGNVNSQVVCDAVATQYISIDCGSIDVPEYFGGFLDYNADYQIYLPYIGYKPMKVDDFTHGYIHVKYWVDILTGVTQACIKCKDKNGVGKVLYSYVGNCFTELPISGANFARMKQAQMNAVVGGISSIATAGLNLATGNLAGAVSGLIGGAMESKQMYDNAKPDYEHGGGLSGNAMFSVRYPYLIQTRYNAKYASNYKKLHGIPSKSFHYLKDLIGFTQIENVVIDSLTHCTKEEKDSIITMLKEGVYL